MRLLSLDLISFRNYLNISIQFNHGRNILIGRNAQGKTNLLEAIYLLCLTRSFRTIIDKELVNFRNDKCTIKGEFILDNGNTKKVIFYYDPLGKKISVNRKKIEPFSKYIGQFPVIVSSPEEYSLTSGPPAERRRFLDILLSQMSKKYIQDLQDYYRILKQRNELLTNQRYSLQYLKMIIEPWNQSFIEIGSRIIKERIAFCDKFKDEVSKIYLELTNSCENINIKYKSKIKIDNSETIAESFKSELAEIQILEIERGKTLLGPHRDDVIFMINENELRKFGSRGQHKTVLIAMAIAEFKLIKEKINETPIILIDDLFSEIDKFRIIQIMEQLQDLGQTFISTTLDKSNFKSYDNLTYFQIENGNIRDIK